ncbi:hypothetical protein J6Z19_06560, partial [bacterium]|nr:hypothetical protein [bacterium]
MSGHLRLFLVFLGLILFVSCSSSKSQNDSDTVPDSDIDTHDSETVDDDSDTQEAEIIDDFEEIPDEYVEPVYPDPVCIYIYPGQEDSKLCFGPVKTDVKCKANPKENQYVTVLESDPSMGISSPLGNVDDPMDINDDFVFFVLNPKNKKFCFSGETYCPNIYGCNRKNNYVYEIVVSKFIHSSFTVDGERIVFNVWDGVKTSSNASQHKLMVGSLKTNETFDITDWGSFGKMQIKYPYVVFLDISDNPVILNLETHSTEKISSVRCDNAPRIDDRHLVCRGKYIGEGLSKDELDVTAWLVDLETFEVSPLSILTYSGETPVISADYVELGSSRDTVYYENYPGKLSGMEIYSFNLKTKREEKWTPEIKGIFEGNFTMPSFEYPYFSYVANETEMTSTGSSYVVNIETGEVTKLYPNIGQEWPYIKDGYLLLGGYVRNGIAKLPDLPKLPENAAELCEDNNPCTDNRYFVTDGECHFIPNHERCDDDDDTTLFDICIDGVCKGFAGTSTDEEMVTVEAGKFIYDG